MTFLARICPEPLDLERVVAAVSRPDAGAIATFSGAVRNQSEGQPVTLLEYEAYAAMAEKEMVRIMLTNVAWQHVATVDDERDAVTTGESSVEG